MVEDGLPRIRQVHVQMGGPALYGHPRKSSLPLSPPLARQRACCRPAPNPPPSRQVMGYALYTLPSWIVMFFPYIFYGLLWCAPRTFRASEAAPIAPVGRAIS